MHLNYIALYRISILTVVILCFSIATYGQEKAQDPIDLLLLEAENAYSDYEDTRSLELANKAGKLALKASEKKKEAKSYVLMARILATSEMEKESLKYIRKAEELGYAKNDPVLLAELMEVKAYNYKALRLISQSFQQEKVSLTSFMTTIQRQV